VAGRGGYRDEGQERRAGKDRPMRHNKKDTSGEPYGGRPPANVARMSSSVLQADRLVADVGGWNTPQ
jgi:hypothetical protein